MANRERPQERPLSPHLQVYRWQVQMVTSILHRATGVILTLGSLLVVWALLALAAGPERWAQFADCARSPLGFIVLFGWSWALALALGLQIALAIWSRTPAMPATFPISSATAGSRSSAAWS